MSEAVNNVTSIETKLAALAERYTEVGELLGQPQIIANQPRFRDLAREYARLEPLVADYTGYRRLLDDIGAAEELRASDDPEARDLGESELGELLQQRESRVEELMLHLVPTDPHDNANLFLEVRAGTGGDEAALFAGDLFRMYQRFAENNRWTMEILSRHEGEHGGYKEIICRVAGKGAYAKLKFESGTHRVQRVPETESQGRIHTSACTVAVMPEPDDVADVEINPSDLRVDTYRASGAGGQHVNKTDSAVRLTHLPSGIVVECQDERSQHKNRARALSLLRARLKDADVARQQAETAERRRKMVGSGDRSERIRTYNFPEHRVADHRINLTLYKLSEILEGGLDRLVEPLAREHQADRLAELLSG